MVRDTNKSKWKRAKDSLSRPSESGEINDELDRSARNRGGRRDEREEEGRREGR